jgi:hypothetical protein
MATDRDTTEQSITDASVWSVNFAALRIAVQRD